MRSRAFPKCRRLCRAVAQIRTQLDTATVASAIRLRNWASTAPPWPVDSMRSDAAAAVGAGRERRQRGRRAQRRLPLARRRTRGCLAIPLYGSGNFKKNPGDFLCRKSEQRSQQPLFLFGCQVEGHGRCHLRCRSSALRGKNAKTSRKWQKCRN
jgi:hypothetical protein